MAILLVLGEHFPYYKSWAKIGWIGVDLFFVLSGFLISGLLFREYQQRNSIDFPRFFLRRGLKIWPPLYVFLAVISAVIAFGAAPFPAQGMTSAFLFYRNYVPWRTEPPVIDHTWSLGVEEHFYILLPLLLIIMIALGRRRPDPFAGIPWMFFVLSTGCLLLRLYSKQEEMFASHLRIDSLFAGVTLGYLFHFRRRWFDRMSGNHALWIACLCCVPIAIFPRQSLAIRTFGVTGLFVGFSFLLAWVTERKPKSRAHKQACRVIAAIGVYSYSIYLWHNAAAIVMYALYPNSGFAFWAYLALALSIGIGMAKLVEFPSIRLRETIIPRSQHAQMESSAPSQLLST